MTNEQWFEKAVAYFNNSMSKDEAQHFESETAADKELFRLMQLWKDTDKDATFYEQHKEQEDAFAALHQRLKPLFVSPEQEGVNADNEIKNRPGMAAWKWMAAAAAIAGLVFLVGNIMQKDQRDDAVVAEQKKQNSTQPFVQDSTANGSNATKDSAQKPAPALQNNIQTEVLYAQVFKTDEVPEDTNGKLDDAFFYYASEQYKDAIKAFDDAANEPVTRGDHTSALLTRFYVVYYKALSQMNLGNTDAANDLLKEAIRLSPAEDLKVKAQWYLALANLKERNIAAADTLLLSVISNAQAGIYKSKAQKLRKAITR